jgi:DNA polymerase III psi subunit
MSGARHNNYLQRLGIVQYVSKDLPLVSIGQASAKGAESARLVLGTVDGDRTGLTDKSIGRSMGAASNSIDLPAKSTSKVSGFDIVTKPKLPRVKISVTEPQSLSNVAAKFSLWQPTGDLLVCGSVDEALPDPEQILLLGNILLAMGQGNGQLPSMDIIEWPPYPNATGDIVEAKEFLGTLIRARIDSKSAKLLLLMGAGAAEWLLSAEEQASVTNGQVSIYDQVTALVVPSLADMIAQPQRKREAWQTIRYLSPLRVVNKYQQPS